jgi:hypothetical protein
MFSCLRTQLQKDFFKLIQDYVKVNFCVRLSTYLSGCASNLHPLDGQDVHLARNKLNNQQTVKAKQGQLTITLLLNLGSLINKPKRVFCLGAVAQYVITSIPENPART